MDSYFRQFGLKWKMWITRGLLRCFYQLSGLSFWRHPFTAEDPLVNNNIMLHFSKTVIMKKQKALEMKKRMQLLSFECHHFCCRFGRAQDSAAKCSWTSAVIQTNIKGYEKRCTTRPSVSRAEYNKTSQFPRVSRNNALRVCYSNLDSVSSV